MSVRTSCSREEDDMTLVTGKCMENGTLRAVAAYTSTDCQAARPVLYNFTSFSFMRAVAEASGDGSSPPPLTVTTSQSRPAQTRP